ncbi:uncharacterized protein BDR25DRAFT_129824 [Lindgomyces ingoldianus]|uniref:Uncharacterized protein n=1 Tax=Lindgomyces ingoldianus TaxID=673940 RepID=A0ACB6R1L9_9PLEO|nr:uncharacterized protein BDR25DRAFT_129824 [Lindgomyces ingoldianus]KAF2473224.1 hypothetical protein BDR25DRAFT_129824 [Lindgomyces ingoldianus]
MDAAPNPSSGHNVTRTGTSGKAQKRPMKSFMFIDSSQGGQNSKPDKAVRSFVMHQARRQKPWSTRKSPQSPSTGTAPTKPSQKRSSFEIPRRADEIAPASSWFEYDPSPNSWNAQSGGSPVSSSSSSVSGRSSQPCLTPPSSDGSVCNFPLCNGEACGQLHAALARRDGFSLGVLDPFDSLPVKADAKTSALIDHFVSIISPRLLPVDLHQTSTITTTEWVASSLRNDNSAPFTYAMLTTSALHLQAMGANNAENALYYKGRAISEINTNLSDPKTSVDDSNIAAVFMLLCLEESQLAPVEGKAGNDPEWNEMHRQIHLNGLRTMIQQRGGLAALSANRCLQVFILMHSIAHSIASFQRPYTTLLDSTGSPQKYDLPSFRSRPASHRILRLFRDLKLDTDLLDIISNVVVFTGDISSWFEDRRCPVDPLELQKHISLLMYRLFDWYTKEGEDDRNPLDQCICLGVLIFLVRTSQPQENSYRTMILTTVRKLRAALTRGSIFRWAKSPDLLLWTLTMGALAAQGSTEADFFAQYCSVAFAGAGFDEKTTAEELLDRMRKCLWIPLLLDNDVKKLWTQMGLARGEELEDDGLDGGLLSPEIKDDDVVGLLTSTRFFSNKRR